MNFSIWKARSNYGQGSSRQPCANTLKKARLLPLLLRLSAAIESCGTYKNIHVIEPPPHLRCLRPPLRDSDFRHMSQRNVLSMNIPPITSSATASGTSSNSTAAVFNLRHRPSDNCAFSYSLLSDEPVSLTLTSLRFLCARERSRNRADAVKGEPIHAATRETAIGSRGRVKLPDSRE